MRSLAIETATEACSVALFEDGRLLAHAHELVGRGHAERLVPMIAALPDRGRAARVLVDCGPGSFTGVRVGLAAARGLGIAWGANVVGYSSLSLLAAMGAADTEKLAVAIVGGHGDVFVQLFVSKSVHPITELQSLKPEAAAALCGALPLIGSGAALVRDAGATGPVRPLHPDARATALLPLALAALPPSPLYGRAPDARPPGS